MSQPTYMLPNMVKIAHLIGTVWHWFEAVTLEQYHTAITSKNLSLPPGWVSIHHNENDHQPRSPGIEGDGIKELQRAALIAILDKRSVLDAFQRIWGLQPSGAKHAVNVTMLIHTTDTQTVPALEQLVKLQIIVPVHYNPTPTGVAASINLTHKGYTYAQVASEVLDGWKRLTP